MKLYVGALDSYYLHKTELAYFHGNLAQYWSFMCAFENNIVKRVNDNGLRLTYLQHYCRAPARETMERCSRFPLMKGYHLALQDLKELFGDEHQIYGSLMDSLKMISNV